ncbi:MAG: 16S rRNA (cytosine(1402)-N(4))-methyltransferase RsmH [Planctomycetota bacterium]|nr:16S rRNA (cytosine(1402)-N(4))-methyltransferase RsmH [Planctomycetota bacterium]
MNGHVPVLRDEVVQGLDPKVGEHLLDLTLGRGGHASVILEKTAPGGRLVGVDQDPDALTHAAEILPPDRSQLVHGNFGDLPDLRKSIGVGTWDLVLADLGVSSPQLDESDRGFSFRKDGPLDMRMDTTRQGTAAELLERITEGQLVNLISELGEDRFARRIAAAIVRAQAEEPIRSTERLAEVIRAAVPNQKDSKVDAATRTFQALRIAINGELDALQHLLDRAGSLLSPGGRLAVISYHSLEDRKVKETFRTLMKEGDHRLVTPRPVRPTDSEVRTNPRSRSARMRIISRLGGTS